MLEGVAKSSAVILLISTGAGSTGAGSTGCLDFKFKNENK